MGNSDIAGGRSSNRTDRQCRSHAWAETVLAVHLMLVSIALSGCSRTAPPLPVAPSNAPDPMAIAFQAAAVFPAGRATLQVVGDTWPLIPTPPCQPLFGTDEGSSISTPVVVEQQAPGWLIHSDPAYGDIEFVLSHTGQTSFYGEALTGSISGSGRDIPVVPGALVRRLIVMMPRTVPPLIVEGNGLTTVAHVEGTIQGPTTFRDPSGGHIDCSRLRWFLVPDAGLS